MPIEKSKENDGSPLNNFSGLTISNEGSSKNQPPLNNNNNNNNNNGSNSTSTTSTGSSGPAPYVPPSLRRNRDFQQPQQQQPPRGGDYERRGDRRDSRDRDYRDSRDSRDSHTDNTRQDTNRSYERPSEPVERRENTDQPAPRDNRDFRDNRDYRDNRDFRNDSRDFYSKGSPSGYKNDRWDNGRSSGGGYNSPSYGRSSAFNRSGAFGGKGRPQIERYFDKWNSYRDPRIHTDMKREDFTVLDEKTAEEIFKSKANHGLDFDSYDDDDISIETSEHICAPLNSFMDIDLGDVLFRNIQYAKYTKPTPVQKSALPIIMKGRDLMACAQTGSGKTAAFLFPIISGILLEGPPEPLAAYRPGVPRPIHPRALVLAPTRELAQQIYEEAQKFSYGSPVTSVVVYGGAEISQQIAELDRGCDILVATTGRLVDLLSRGRVSLSAVKYLVLDEADRMLDMGFEPQIRQIVCDNDLPGNRDRQTLMFSATFPKPIQNLASDFLNNYIFLKVGVIGTTQNITQRIEYVQDEEKNSYLLDFLSTLKSDGLTLIFVETKRLCDSLTHFLNTKGFPSTCIHGDLSQYERESALNSFRTNQTPYLVATDVASRGLHIPNVLYVINFDLPTDIHVYVHRIGRTGRAGKKGFAISFYNERNKSLAPELVSLMRKSNQDIPEWFERTVSYSYNKPKNTPPQKSRYNNNNDSPFSNSNKGYNNYNNNNSSSNNDRYNRNDNRRGGERDDYSMHHNFFNNGGQY